MTDLLGKALPTRSHVEKILAATGDLGKASGLEAAAEILLAMADHNRRVVGTSELRAAAASFKDTAEKLRQRSNATIKAAEVK